MSNGNQYERLFKLWAMICKMILDGKRNAGLVADILQEYVIEANWIPIPRTFAFDPVASLGEGWSIVEEDERSLKLSKVNLAKVSLETMLKDGESRVVGEEKLQRLRDAWCIRLDARIFQTLWENQHFIPESWKQLTNGNITYVYFDGTILQDSIGDRYVLCLCWSGGGWHWDYSRLVGVSGAVSPSAVLKI